MYRGDREGKKRKDIKLYRQIEVDSSNVAKEERDAYTKT